MILYFLMHDSRARGFPNAATTVTNIWCAFTVPGTLLSHLHVFPHLKNLGFNSRIS